MAAGHPRQLHRHVLLAGVYLFVVGLLAVVCRIIGICLLVVVVPCPCESDDSSAGGPNVRVVTKIPPCLSTATPPGATSESAMLVFTPSFDCPQCPDGREVRWRVEDECSGETIRAISSTYIVPSRPKVRSITDENPVATLVQPLLGSG